MSTPLMNTSTESHPEPPPEIEPAQMQFIEANFNDFLGARPTDTESMKAWKKDLARWIHQRIFEFEDPIAMIREDLNKAVQRTRTIAVTSGKGFFADTSGRAYDAARAALASAWGSDTVFVATGGSIPLVSALSEAAPSAEMLLLGTTDGFANIHAPNERVLLDEFEKAVLAEAEFLGRYAASFDGEERS